MTAATLPTPELLRKMLRYEPDTGLLFWRERTSDMFKDNARECGRHSAQHNCNAWNAKFAGKEAFRQKMATGHLIGGVFNRSHLAHRVIWAMETGVWPKDEVDHIDHNGGNNRWANLREATRQENMRNSSMPKDNTSGFVGVCWDKHMSKWRSRIVINKTSKSLGSFTDIDDAISARQAANIKYGFHENHGKKEASI